MAVISLLSAAIAPGLTLLAYFYLKDRYDAEPFPKVVLMFMLGVFTVIPAIILQHGIEPLAGGHPFIYSFVVTAGLEESLKWLVLMLVIFNHKVFDEPYDGIVYAVAVSLGFATVENIMYAWFSPNSFSALLYRAFLPVSGHALFGVVMGYYLGKAKFTGQRNKFIAYSLLLPVIWHGLFDYILLSSEQYWAWFIFPFMLILWIRSMRNVNTANARSPFRWLKREEEIKLEEIRS
ncbi:peptidase [Paenibacillus swuensis]|uniref:Protease PrsW n=1 Tax=Paenibacillus swuensis TaxID=1178515 RepID=A0A172TLS9_9BACL|nr:glutamic-type intramembrane protease PrsW [Paenibacillus swuensis]ANE47988.1 peptidase [Paenibacillus swuensis]